MPFTFSHPAIVLPLIYLPRKWFSLTGLVVGSLVPDFEYFLRMKVESKYSHTISGMFWFDLPLGLIAAIIFHTSVRNCLIDNTPPILKNRLRIFKEIDWLKHFKDNWIIVIVSIIIGSASHLFWDGFTHEHGYFVKTYSLFNSTGEFFNRQIPLYKILQHASTLLGALMIAASVYKLPSNERGGGHIDFKYWTIAAGITITIVTLRIMTGLEIQQYGSLIVTTISGGLISLIITPIFIKGK